MPRVISPLRTELDSLRQPLEPGERQVLEFFDAHLPEEWEIYVQPHLNGLRPDFVLLHPRIGIAVFEVKDWNLKAFTRWMDVSTGHAPNLMGRKDGKEFSLQRDNPVDKVLLYKDEIHNLYCPRLEEQMAYGVITAGIIFPAADDQEALDLLKPSLQYKDRASEARIYPVSGRQALARGDLRAVFPEATRSSSKYMTPEKAADLRMWLVECLTTFTEDPFEERRKKLGFFMGDARIKMTTFHRFKGWEARALILCLDHALETKDRTLLYIGMTRTKRHELGSFLTVVCSEPTMAHYGRTWPTFEAETVPIPIRVQMNVSNSVGKLARSQGHGTFAVGARVRSQRWGPGTILEVITTGTNCVYTVRFDQGVEKRIVEGYLELEPI